VTIGDVMLDVIVDAGPALRLDDDTNASIRLAPGGQAANVAAWAVALGAEATVIGPRGSSTAATIVSDRLTAAGVDFAGIDAGEVGTVVSIVAGHTRTMASDAGLQDWVASVRVDQLPGDATALHVSGYPLLRGPDPTPIVAVCDEARSRRIQISVDLSSAAMIGEYGPAAFTSLLHDVSPDVVFANADEWAAIGRSLPGLDTTVVVKDGSRDVTVIEPDGRHALHRVEPTHAVDLTGAGDALAAGYLVGGVDLGIATAARCVAMVGAQPVRRQRPGPEST
jgi:sugar/nucleoside kinase (ribokinase family)